MPTDQTKAAARVAGTQNSPSTNATKDKDNDHKLHFRWGGIYVGAGLSHFSAPYYPYYPFGPYAYAWGWGFDPLFWDPIYYSPFLYGGYPQSLAYAYGRGEVRLSSDVRDAEVYLDGAYAGVASQRKSMWLDPGVYHLSVSAKDRTPFQQRTYVLSGKSLKISAELPPESTPSRTDEKPEAKR